MQFQSSDRLSHHGIRALYHARAPNMVTVRVRSKLKQAENRLFSQKKVRKNSRYFVGVFNKTIIPPALVGDEMIIANSYPTCTRGIIVKYISTL